MAVPVLRTLVAAAALGAGVLAHAWSVTDGFQRMTYESLREKRVARGELVAPAIALTRVDGPGPVTWPDARAPDAPRAWLVDFVAARCPGVCRALGGDFRQMAASLRAEDPAGTVGLLTVSIAQPRDRPQDLADYARAHHADGRRWWVAQAGDDDSRRLLQALQVVAIPDGQGGLVHNGDIHLLDATGRVRGLYGYDEWPRALADARHLAGETR